MGLFEILKRMVSGSGPADAASEEAIAAADASPGKADAGTESKSTATPTPVDKGRVLLIHGYSAGAKDLLPWRDALRDAAIETKTIAVGNYITLNNEVSIKDLGEAFDRALRLTKWSAGSKDDTWTFDAVVHSTGMLVLRQWLTSDPFPRDDPRSRVRRLKHLVGLAPATFGSPQAQQGRSWLGAFIKGSKTLGPDFMNAGNQVLDGLELASRYTWELAHRDMVCAAPLYDKGAGTPYVAVFIGNHPYDGVAALSNSPGCDGTVRWAGCALNTRKVSIDFRRQPKLTGPDGQATRCCITDWVADRLAVPMIAVDGQNHGTIVADPQPKVVDLVTRFLKVADSGGYATWEAEAEAFGAIGLQGMNKASGVDHQAGAGWQQLIVHLVDDHGDGVKDFNLQLYTGDDLDQSDDPEHPTVPSVVNTYTGDGSYRCFYIRLTPAMLALNTEAGEQKKMWIELIASSGSKLIEYEAYTGEATSQDPGKPQRLTIDHTGGAPVKLEITHLAQGKHTLLYPYTTTLLEIFVEREPTPLGAVADIFGIDQ